MSDRVQRDIDLQPYNTMALPARASHYARAENLQAIREAADYAKLHALPIVVLGGGSNTLFAGNFPGMVLHVASRGVNLVEEGENDVLVRVAAGEEWDFFLQHCMQQHWYGLENLAMIPGTVGAAPVQNIGAYGQEVASAIENVHLLYFDTLAEAVLTNRECRFSYRESIFKQALRDKCVVTAVDFRLQKQFTPNLSYQALADQFAGKPDPAAEEVRAAVMAIRQVRLPSPQAIPNAGSFFKNPVVSQSRFEALLAVYPQMPSFRQSSGEVKLAAAWLIDQCGWKGRRLGCVGMHDQQALVMVNHGGATYADIERLARAIKQDVADKFAVWLEEEPVVVAAQLP